MDNIPDEFLCPITLEIMKDPVLCEDGHTYERTAIMKISGSLSPLTKEIINKSKLIPNRALKNAIDRFLSSDLKYQGELLERKNEETLEIVKQECIDVQTKIDSTNLIVEQLITEKNRVIKKLYQLLETLKEPNANAEFEIIIQECIDVKTKIDSTNLIVEQLITEKIRVINKFYQLLELKI